jgi:hypothetical protein
MAFAESDLVVAVASLSSRCALASQDWPSAEISRLMSHQSGPSAFWSARATLLSQSS